MSVSQHIPIKVSLAETQKFKNPIRVKHRHEPETEKIQFKRGEENVNNSIHHSVSERSNRKQRIIIELHERKFLTQRRERLLKIPNQTLDSSTLCIA